MQQGEVQKPISTTLSLHYCVSFPGKYLTGGSRAILIVDRGVKTLSTVEYHLRLALLEYVPTRNSVNLGITCSMRCGSMLERRGLEARAEGKLR